MGAAAVAAAELAAAKATVAADTAAEEKEAATAAATAAVQKVVACRLDALEQEAHWNARMFRLAQMEIGILQADVAYAVTRADEAEAAVQAGGGGAAQAEAVQAGGGGGEAVVTPDPTRPMYRADQLGEAMMVGAAMRDAARVAHKRKAETASSSSARHEG